MRDDKQDAWVEKYGGNLTGESYPPPIDLPDLPEAFLRKWILRTSSVVPEGDALRVAAKSLEEFVQRLIITEVQVNEAHVRRLVSVSAVRLSDHHAVLEIICPAPTATVDMGDAPAIATIRTLQEADDLWKVEDIQGIPKAYWRFMAWRDQSKNERFM